MRKYTGYTLTLTVLLVTFTLPLFSFGKNKVNYEVFDWKILNTIHCSIYYPDGMEELAMEAAKIAEEACVHIGDYLNHELTDVIPVMLYPSHVAFQNNNIMPYLIGESTGGFTESMKNRVVVPFTGSYVELRHVLTHELVHAFQFNILFADTSGELMGRFGIGRIPLWVVEGMAEYLSIGYDDTADMVMRDILFNEKYATLQDLTRLYIRSPYLLYKQGQAFYYYLEKEYGKKAIGEFFRDVRDLNDLNGALKSVTGKDIEDVNKEWIRFFKKRYYPLVARKNYEDEEARQLTHHMKTYSGVNTAPAVSPDGKYIAYLTDKNIYPSIVIRKANERKDKKDKKVRVVLKGATSSGFVGMHLMDNKLSWSSSGKELLFVAQGGGRDIIYVIHPVKGKIIEKIYLPLRAVKYPSLSLDARQVVFTGVSGGYPDVYLYDRKKKNLKKITDDKYMEKNPSISPDNRSVLFSSNRNGQSDPLKGDFNIYQYDLIDKKTTVLVSGKGDDIQGELNRKGDKLLYVSNRSGIYNVYIHDLKKNTSKKVTDVLSGVFSPRWFPDENRIAMVAYQNLGYDIMVKHLRGSKRYEETENQEIIKKDVIYNPTYYDFRKTILSDYSPGLSSDVFLLMLTGTLNYGFAGIVQVAFSDDMGDHRLVLTGNFIRQDKNNDLNFDAAYYYLKHRVDIGIGAFSQTNPFLIYSIGDINDLIHNANLGTVYLNHYGGYIIGRYPFHRFFRLEGKMTISRYEHDYSLYDSRSDVFANLNQFAVGLSYDNVLWGRMSPVDGFRGGVSFEQAVNVTGQDFNFSSVDVDLRRYFLINKRYVFAFRGMFGSVFGKDAEYFKYYLGGFNTLRGHPFLGYSGKYMYLLNAEFRFTAVEGIKLGWPLFLGIGRIGGVLFVDMGSAWDGKYNFVNKSTGTFDDFKMDMGFGFRLALFPIIVLKLDFAWPFYRKSFGNMDIIFSLGFEY